MTNKNTQMKTLENIQNLQTMERDLQKKLDTSVAGKSLSKKEQDNIVDKINELTQIRTNLYSNLNDMYKSTQANVAQNRNELVNEMVTSGIIENEMNNAKASLKALDDNKNNKLRMVEINSYFGGRYREYSRLMKHVIYFAIPVLLLAILSRKGLIPGEISNVLISIIISIGILVLGYRVYDLSMRDNMNFDEYNWNFNPNNVLVDSYSDDYDTSNHPDFFNENEVQSHTFFSDLKGECVGASCCGKNMKYDKANKKCVPVSNKEAFRILESNNKKPKKFIEAFSRNSTYASY